MGNLKYFSLLTLLFLSLSCQNDNPVTPPEPLQGTISGTVSTESGNPLQGAVISTIPATSTAVTNSEGHYNIPDISPRQYSVKAEKYGYYTKTLGIEVTAGNITAADFLLTAEPPLPLGSFIYSADTAFPCTVTFQNTSQNADLYLWDFGDGSVSDEVNPVHIYNSKGAFIVSLKASNSATHKYNIFNDTILFVPSALVIDQLLLHSIPFTVMGSPWDPFTSGDETFPDVTSRVDGGGSLFKYTALANNLKPENLPCPFGLNMRINQTDWQKTFKIVVEDWDDYGSTFQIIGITQIFTISAVANKGYPQVYRVSNVDNSIIFDLILKWE